MEDPVEYVVRFTEPEHHWMEVEVTFRGLGTTSLQARMSRTSPGRYALHEFAKNVFDVRFSDGAGNELSYTRPNPHQWDVAGHDGTVVARYKIFGDRADGTYLAVDTTHAHMNMPATLMWGRGLEDRAAILRLTQPEGARWQVATQLFPTEDPLIFTAPNLQYLLDSPTEFGATTIRSFEVDGPEGPQTIRVALHHEAGDELLEGYVRAVRMIVGESREVYGEFPTFDGGTYTFIADYLPYASGDGMEHRNSTILSSSGSLRVPQQRIGLLGTVAHEFFHAWNVERIRPASLEPFDFEHANMSDELWFAEGFTNYYTIVLMSRAGLYDTRRALDGFRGAIEVVSQSPGRRFRSAVQMSRRAPFVDAARSVDPTYWNNTFVSYYTFGSALGLGLDLSLRELTDNRVTLDDFMRAMWLRYGKPGGPAPGFVANPYTVAGARAVLAEVWGDAAFADEFFDRYIEGRELPDYERLLRQAGFQLRQRAPRTAWIGASFGFSANKAVVSASTNMGSPAYQAGLDRGDTLLSIGGTQVRSQRELLLAVGNYRPGDTATIRFLRRGGEVESTITFTANPGLELITFEDLGTAPTEAHLAFRRDWLGSKRR